MNIVEALQQAGVNVSASDNPQQVSCPFHGKDEHPSMRVYPATNTAYCFVCKRAYNPVAVYALYNGIEYRQALARLGITYGSVDNRNGPNPESPVKRLEELLLVAIRKLPREQVDGYLTRSGSGEPARPIIEELETALMADRG